LYTPDDLEEHLEYINSFENKAIILNPISQFQLLKVAMWQAK
jgi:hypothetical protein